MKIVTKQKGLKLTNAKLNKFLGQYNGKEYSKNTKRIYKNPDEDFIRVELEETQAHMLLDFEDLGNLNATIAIIKSLTNNNADVYTENGDELCSQGKMLIEILEEICRNNIPLDQ